MGAKTVGELKALIANLPDEMKLVKEGSDHSYDHANVFVAKAEVLYSKTGRQVQYMWEYYDKGNMSDKKSKVEDVLVAG